MIRERERRGVGRRAKKVERAVMSDERVSVLWKRNRVKERERERELVYEREKGSGWGGLVSLYIHLV